jgi:lipoprotein-releasing system permease protein
MVSLFVARRYLFSKNTRNAVNLISLVAIIGFTAGTAALVVVLSVFNGFDSVVGSLYHGYDSDFKITPSKGKYIYVDTNKIKQLQKLADVAFVSTILEENALLRYADRQTIALVRGVDRNYYQTTSILDAITDGDSTPWKYPQYALIGRGLGNKLNIEYGGHEQLIIYMPDKNVGNVLAEGAGFEQQGLSPSHEFSIQSEIDSKTMLVPIEVMRQLMNKESEISVLEVKLKSGADEAAVRKDIYDLLGNEVKIENRYEQHALLNKIMKSEKQASYIILTFILLIASFNMVAGLMMLVLEKKNNINTLVALGADKNIVRKIFLYEGLLISFIGTFVGLLLGFTLCWLQINYGFITIPESDTMVISSYPVKMRLNDFIYIAITAAGLGLLASWYPARKAANWVA